MSKATEVFENVSARLIRSIDEGLESGTWRAPWRINGSAGLAHNPISGTAYQGFNQMILLYSAIDRGFSTNGWATYKQLAEHGGQVRKGEKGTSLVRWVEPSGKRDRAAGSDRKPHLVPVAFTVFNLDQQDGYVAPERPPAPEPIAHAERFFRRIGARVFNTNADSAHFIPSTDIIELPFIDHFVDAESYYAVLGHEHTHWSGGKGRFEREGVVGDRSDVKVVAFEELIAEIGAALLNGHLGIESAELDDQHRAYLRHWKAAVTVDPKALYRAAGAAQKACNFLLERGAEVETEVAA